MATAEEIAPVIDRYEALRGGPATAERIFVARALTFLLRRHGKFIDSGGLRYSYDVQNDCVARVLIEGPVVGSGKSARKEWPKGMRYRRRGVDA
jgi:hypothetical protein